MKAILIAIVGMAIQTAAAAGETESKIKSIVLKDQQLPGIQELNIDLIRTEEEFRGLKSYRYTLVATPYGDPSNELGYLIYEIQKDSLIVKHIQLAPQSKQFGMQDILFKAALKENPKVAKIQYGVTTASNQELFAAGLLEEIKKSPNFDVLNRGETLSAREVERLKSFHKKYFPNSPSSLALHECCSNFMKNIQSHPEKFQEVLRRAASRTPAFLTSNKFGFKKVCGAVDVSLDNNAGIIGNFSACK